MADEIVGSHFKSQRGRGQNQDQSPSSVSDKTLPIIPNVAPPNAGTPNTNEADDSRRLAEISDKPITVHDGMRNRSTHVETVPSATIRRDSGKRL